jgi:hypothetical protein
MIARVEGRNLKLQGRRRTLPIFLKEGLDARRPKAFDGAEPGRSLVPPVACRPGRSANVVYRTLAKTQHYSADALRRAA